MILEYNLQFFAKDGPGGERTEPATAKKLRDARKKGQVAKSREVVNGFCLLSLFLLLKIWAGRLGTGMGYLFPAFYDWMPEMAKSYGDPTHWQNFRIILRNAVIRVIVIAAPVYLVGYVVAFATNLWQVKWRPTTYPLKPKLKKLNPVNGLKKLLSPSSLVELVKAILKVLVLLIVTINYVKKNQEFFFRIMYFPIRQALGQLGKVVIDLGLRICIVYMFVAFADYAYTKWKFKDDMKMTKQEVKEEWKESEGDPAVKSKQRQRMQEASRRRMMQDLVEADVVITNPTHYAVAIKYDSELYTAPIVIAKGADYLAQKIKEVARENKIEIYEDKPVARMLYANVEIGEMIPPELYMAVADILAYVYKLQGKV